MQELHDPPCLLHGDGLGLGGVPVGGEDPGLELVVHGLPRVGARHVQAGELGDEQKSLIIDGPHCSELRQSSPLRPAVWPQACPGP